MFTQGLSTATKANLATLKKVDFVKDYYLAGGTALSLHFGHRFSNDLDFFSQTPVLPEVIRSELSSIGKLEIIQNDQGTFNGILNDAKVSFFIYPYGLLNSPVDFEGIKVADMADIACMKIDAISSRGTKRDFIDLYFICNFYKPVTELLDLYSQKYTQTKFNILHIIKSLVYFTDAENDVSPKMIKEINWDEIKKYFIESTKKINLQAD